MKSKLNKKRLSISKRRYHRKTKKQVAGAVVNAVANKYNPIIITGYGPVSNFIENFINPQLFQDNTEQGPLKIKYRADLVANAENQANDAHTISMTNEFQQFYKDQMLSSLRVLYNPANPGEFNFKLELSK